MISNKRLKQNKKVFYRIPKKYKALNQLFTGEIRDLYFKIMNFLKDKELIKYQGELCFVLSTEMIRKIRKKGARETANHYINYLCLMGIFEKKQQMISEDTILDINLKLLEKHNKKWKPLNVYRLICFNTEDKEILNKQLEKIENNCKQLIEHKIKPSNISKDLLIINGLGDKAEEYYPTTKQGLSKKDDYYFIITKFIDEQIKTKGYTSKQEIIDNIALSKNLIEKIIKQYKIVFEENYKFKAPNKQEKEKFKLHKDFKKHIIIAK